MCHVWQLALLLLPFLAAAGNIVLYQPVPTVAAARAVANATKPYVLSVTILPNSSPLYTGHAADNTALLQPQVMLIVDVEAANMQRVRDLASLAIEAILPPQTQHAATASSSSSSSNSLAWVQKVAAQPPFPPAGAVAETTSTTSLPPVIALSQYAPLPPALSASSNLQPLQNFLDKALPSLSRDLPDLGEDSAYYSSRMTSGGCVPPLAAGANVTTNYVLLDSASAYIPVYLAKGHQEFNVTTRVKQDITLTMEGVPGTGYVWMVDHSLTAAELKTGSIKLYPCRSVGGSSGFRGGVIANQPRMYHLKVQPQEIGNFTLTVVHARPWDRLDSPSWKIVHFSVLPKFSSNLFPVDAPDAIQQRPAMLLLTSQKPQNPTFQNPTFQNPTFQNPTLQNPTLQNPTLRNPTLRNPTLRNPAFTVVVA